MMWFRIRNKPRKEVNKNNYFYSFVNMGGYVSEFDILCLIDKRVCKSRLAEEIIKHKDLLVDAFLVEAASYKRNNVGFTKQEFIELETIEVVDLIRDRKLARDLAKKILNLQLKKGLFKLKDGKLIPTKKWEKLKKDLTPFIEYLID